MWQQMSEEKAKKELHKLQNMKFQVGWGQKPKNVPALSVLGPEPPSFDHCMLIGKQYAFFDAIYNWNEWSEMGCYVVNAWYITERNTLFLPCSLFQSPFC